MTTTKQRWGGLVFGLALAGSVIAGVSSCGAVSGQPQNDDLQNVSPSYPNWVGLYLNIDGYPNVVIQCIMGTAFATTQRLNTPSAAFLVPTLNAFCATQEGKQATQDGQP